MIKLPEVRAADDGLDRLEVKGVAGFMGAEMPDERMPDKGKIPNQIQDFVAHEFIGKTQRRIHDLFIVENNSVLQ